MDYSLPSVARHVGFTFAHHDPEEDAVAAAKVGLAALDDIGVESIDDAERRLNRYLLMEFGATRQRSGNIHGASKSQPPFTPTAGDIDPQTPFFCMNGVITGARENCTRAEAIRALGTRGAHAR